MVIKGCHWILCRDILINKRTISINQVRSPIASMESRKEIALLLKHLLINK